MTLKQGSRGVNVAELQADLYRAGFDPGPADGVFGPKTDTAVRAFQKKYGLVVDGIAGPQTLGKLAELVGVVQARPAQGRKLSTNFNEDEFACRHCGKIYIHGGLVNKLQDLRDAIGKPITVTSGYRCPAHNKAVGGATQSRHLQGQAADIIVPGMTPAQVAQAATRVGFGGIGIYKSGFTHVDIGPERRWNG